MKPTPLTKAVIQRIMQRAISIQKTCGDSCCDFQIMTSAMRPDSLILRWTSIDLSDIDRPIQTYRYECFGLDGKALLCSVNYNDTAEANRFFKSLVSLYQQDFAYEHRRL